MSWSYVFADIVIMAIPFMDALHYAGSFWPALWLAYSHKRPLPFISGIVQLVGDKIAGNRFGFGYVLIGAGSAILGLDLVLNHQPYAAVAQMFGLVAGIFGGLYKQLEKHFKKSKSRIFQNTLGAPKRMAGFFLACVSLPTAITGLYYGGYDGHMLFAAGCCGVVEI